jgi:hypothetical protein
MNFDENIVITVEEAEEADSKNDDNSFDINNFLLNNNDFNEDLHLSLSIDYMQNYTVKDLILICDYYGFSKEIKANKLSKELIIQCLVDWELDMKNYKIVKKRQQLWHYINELKNDKFMKKYVLW